MDFGENYVQELLDKAKVLPDSIRRFATTSDPIDCCVAFETLLVGGGFKYLFMFISVDMEMIQFWLIFFQMGWLKPPTRKLLENFDSHHCQPWFSLVCAMFQNSEMMECFHSFCFFLRYICQNVAFRHARLESGGISSADCNPTRWVQLLIYLTSVW